MPVQRENGAGTRFATDSRATSVKARKGGPFDYSPFRARVAARARTYAAPNLVAAWASDYFGTLERSMPGMSAAA